MNRIPESEQERVVLCELLDRLLYKGAVISGEVVISVAGVDLLYLGLELVLTSVEKAHGVLVEELNATERKNGEET